MPSLIVSTQGALLRCAGGQVQVEHERQIIHKAPLHQVDRVILLGGVNFTHGFLTFALERRVPVAILTQDGRYRGRLEPSGLRDGAARLAQYRCLYDIPWRVETARTLVRAKIRVQRSLLQRQHRNHPHEALESASRELHEISARLDGFDTLPSLMGQEGLAARSYFAAFPHTLRKPMPMDGRNRRPPRDPVNALLSLGYGLLTVEVIGMLCAMGLDPQVGFFHSPRGRMPALAEDVLEIFRAPVADSLAISLINLGVLEEGDFQPTEDVEGGVCLKRPALARYMAEYRKKVETPFHNREGRELTFQQAIREEAGHIRRVILREQAFDPFAPPQGGQTGGDVPPDALAPDELMP